MNKEPGFTVSDARYAKNMKAVRCESKGGWKTRAMRLCEHLNGRYSGRENAYIMSEAKTKKLKILFDSDYDASAITGELRK